MNFTRTLALIFAGLLLVTACKSETDEPAAVIAENSNPLLAYVPADTAYVFAALEPSPKEIIDAYVSRFQPVLDSIAEITQQFQSEYASGEFEDNDGARLAAAVLDELGGSVSEESLAGIGISLQAHHVLYATGIFPVMRIELTDETALRDAITRIEAKMGFEIPVRELNGSRYWQVSDDDMPIGLYVAIIEKQLVMSMFPVTAEATLLPALLGQVKPAASIASSNALAALNQEKGYSSYGSGYIDFQTLTDEVFIPQSNTRSYLDPEMISRLDSFDAVCVAELQSMVAKTPRMSAGTTRLTANEIGIRYELEIESSIASGLAALVTDTPVAVQGEGLLSASLALQIGKLRNFVLEKASAIVASPYQCEMLQKLNENAGQLVTQLNIPMPPMVNNLNGARLRVDDFDPDASMPKGNGLLAVHVDKPEMFVGMASMMVPGFEELDLANQSEPVRIPAEMLHVEGVDVFALMAKNALGFAIGMEDTPDLVKFLDEKPQASGTFFSISYDMAKQMEIQQAMGRKFQTSLDDEKADHDRLVNAIQMTYREMLGRSDVQMRFNSRGLLIDTTMTFK